MHTITRHQWRSVLPAKTVDAPSCTRGIPPARLIASLACVVVSLFAGMTAQASDGAASSPDRAWHLLAASVSADAAVFTDSGRHQLVHVGETLGSSGWTLIAIDQDAVLMESTQPNGGEAMTLRLGVGRPLPQPVNMQAIPTAVVEVPYVSTGEARETPP